ncbi:hypothetical protein GCM10027596_08180 [Nocardioides korecus]
MDAVPSSIVLVGLLGLLVLGFGLARIAWLETRLRRAQRPAATAPVAAHSGLPGFPAAA